MYEFDLVQFSRVDLDELNRRQLIKLGVPEDYVLWLYQINMNQPELPNKTRREGSNQEKENNKRPIRQRGTGFTNIRQDKGIKGTRGDDGKGRWIFHSTCLSKGAMSRFRVIQLNGLQRTTSRTKHLTHTFNSNITTWGEWCNLETAAPGLRC